MKKQTAVDLLFEGTLGLTLQLENRRISNRNWELQMVKLFEKAKEMEKEQIKNDYFYGSQDAGLIKRSPEQYYNDTYGGDK